MGLREYAIYDGQNCIGSFVVDEKTGTAKAFNAAGRLLGTFPAYAAARKAISQAHRDVIDRKATAAKALEYLNRSNVAFVSGLPTDIGNGWGR
jgi:hypothetical protein